MTASKQGPRISTKIEMGNPNWREKMKIPNTNITLEDLLDHMPIGVHFVDKDGFLRYQNRLAASRPAPVRREVGVNIKDCHAHPESLEAIEFIFDDFRRGRKEPHFYITPTGRKAVKVPISDAEGNFVGILSYGHPVGLPATSRTF
ncbi:PAS domain-containing protein [Chloroflexota bacterium]